MVATAFAAAIDVRVGELVDPAEGDTFDIDGDVYVFQSEPVRDAERLIWAIEARPARGCKRPFGVI